MSCPEELLAAPSWDFDGGVSLAIPSEGSELAARWADRIVDLLDAYPGRSDLVTLMLSGILKLERERVLSKVERSLVEEF